LVGLKGILWWFFGLVMLAGSEAAASSYMEASGSVSIDKSCGKMTLDDIKVLVRDETPLGNGRPQRVPLDAKGSFSVLLSKSYKYTFQVRLKAEGYLNLDGAAMFDPTYPEIKPTLVARCLADEVKKT